MRIIIDNLKTVANLSIILLFSGNVFAAQTAVHRDLIKAADKQSSNSYAFKKCRNLQSKPFNPASKKKKAIIVGDSQGCDFLNGVLENGYLSNYQIAFRFIPYPCQLVPGENRSKYIRPQDHQLCSPRNERTDNLEEAKKQIEQADLVIMAALWKPEVSQKLPKVIRYLNLKQRQKLIVVGNKFFGKMSIHDYIHMPRQEIKTLRNEVGTTSLHINATLKTKVKKQAVFVDPHQLVCGDNTTCPVFTDRLQLISYDGRHLTKAGARYIGKILFQQSPLKKIR
ncbi:MAG: Unknown protein [uncultured Thiotrichaceae bacterium]|uniref:SGNH domain-containing protein n=1 Tax=uncultured Thiotrichaceae bacterium TaxID=298394 RepID=A0A6S6U5R7_9GAMM|nr:MAG: Unknown protein [uncultured Thiotrichaceae bacterium]